jgi:hypothetical protein
MQEHDDRLYWPVVNPAERELTMRGPHNWFRQAPAQFCQIGWGNVARVFWWKMSGDVCYKKL